MGGKIQCVAVAQPRGRSGPEAGAIAEAFARSGLDTVLLQDGDPRGLDSDLLLMVGSCRGFLDYPRLLARPEQRRPLCAVWQIEVLPPNDFDPAIERLRVWKLLDRNRWRLARSIKRTLLYPVLTLACGLSIRSGRSNQAYTASKLELPLQSFTAIRAFLKQGWLSHVFVSTIQKKEFLESRGIQSTFAPFGMYPGSGEPRDVPKDIDVLFLGRIKGEREAKIAQLGAALEPHGLAIKVVDRDCFDEARTTLLNRAKLLLHLHNFEWDTPWTRWMTATACGVPIVSEPLSRPAPFTPGIHYAEAPFEKLPQAILCLLGDDDARTRIAANCRAHIQAGLTLDHSVRSIIDWAEKEPTAA